MIFSGLSFYYYYFFKDSWVNFLMNSSCISMKFLCPMINLFYSLICSLMALSSSSSPKFNSCKLSITVYSSAVEGYSPLGFSATTVELLAVSSYNFLISSSFSSASLAIFSTSASLYFTIVSYLLRSS